MIDIPAAMADRRNKGAGHGGRWTMDQYAEPQQYPARELYRHLPSGEVYAVLYEGGDGT